ncbi:hypothetical protein RJ641_030342, partial [Dillenia turbinata]
MGSHMGLDSLNTNLKGPHMHVTATWHHLCTCSSPAVWPVPITRPFTTLVDQIKRKKGKKDQQQWCRYNFFLCLNLQLTRYSHHTPPPTRNHIQSFLQNALNLFYTNLGPNYTTPIWGSLCLTDNQTPVIESKTGVSFPSILGNSQRLLGIGLRRKSIFGLKNIDAHAYGAYAEENEIKNTLRDISIPELMLSDVCMTVRLQIMYGKLRIRSVSSALEESIRNRLEKFGGPDNKDLLDRDCVPLEVGTIPGKLLCRAILDLDIGDDPFDKQAKHDMVQKLASL